jgi:hypothetical protein
MHLIPSLVLLPKFLPASPAPLSDITADLLRSAVVEGLHNLDDIAMQAARIQAGHRSTKRSGAPLVGTTVKLLILVCILAQSPGYSE